MQHGVAASLRQHMDRALHLLELVQSQHEAGDPAAVAVMIEEAIDALHACGGTDNASEEVQQAIALLQRAGTRVSQQIAQPPDAFPNAEGRVPSNPLVAAGMAAIWKGGKRARQLQGGWTQSDSGQLSYRHKGAVGGHIVVYPNLVQSAEDALPTTHALWSFVEGLNPFTGDVALAVLAQMVEPTQGHKTQYPLLEPVRITTDAVLRYKGIQRWGTGRRLLEERIADEMERLRSLTFDVQQLPALNPCTGRRQRGTWSGDRLFDIVRVERFQETMFGESELVHVAWLVRAGQWAHWWLNADGRVYLARMARVLLELDHQGTAMAKKIGQRILLQAGTDTTEQQLVVGRLLEDIGELPAANQRDRNWAGRTRERFDQALQQLLDAAVLDEVRWRRGVDCERVRGWVDEWLDETVSLRMAQTPPHCQRALPPAPGGSRPRRPVVECQRVDGDQLVRARKALGWKQDRLAGFLGVSRKHLSTIENGRMLPSTDLGERIQLWLQSVTTQDM